MLEFRSRIALSRSSLLHFSSSPYVSIDESGRVDRTPPAEDGLFSIEFLNESR